MKREVALIHPGVILLEDWLKPMNLSQYALSKAIGVPPRRINEIIHGERGITVDTALRLGAYFGTDAQSWLNLQDHYDTEMAREPMAEVLGRIARREPVTSLAGTVMKPRTPFGKKRATAKKQTTVKRPSVAA